MSLISNIKEKKRCLITIDNLENKYSSAFDNSSYFIDFLEKVKNNFVEVPILLWDGKATEVINIVDELVEKSVHLNSKQKELMISLFSPCINEPYDYDIESLRLIREEFNQLNIHLQTLPLKQVIELWNDIKSKEYPYSSLFSPTIHSLQDRHYLLYSTKTFSNELLKSLYRTYHGIGLYRMSLRLSNRHLHFDINTKQIFLDYYKVRNEVNVMEYLEYRHVFACAQDEEYNQKFHELHQNFALPSNYLMKHFSKFYTDLPSFKDSKNIDRGYFFYLNLDCLHREKNMEATNFMPDISKQVFNCYVELFNVVKEQYYVLGWLYCYLSVIEFSKKTEEEKIDVLKRIKEFYLLADQQPHPEIPFEGDYFREVFVKETYLRDRNFKPLGLEKLSWDRGVDIELFRFRMVHKLRSMNLDRAPVEKKKILIQDV